MMIDTIAERYGMLPSQVLHNASTFDMFICDAAVSYRQELERRAYGKNAPIEQSYSQAELLEILERSRGAKN